MLGPRELRGDLRLLRRMEVPKEEGGSGCAPREGAWTAVSPPGSRSSRMRKISSRRAGASGSSSKCRKESPWRSRAKSPKRLIEKVRVIEEEKM
ncbi:hypothetical protein C4D60_Mb01t15160 [Musa balbisiana]|uniref:Uncharacterized protein n=1 Tax=Musa balbisiana TaxID=52838 RepID=A0A4S8JMQ4_MUSBA|nr:hypothetical protein C4D60_Mb01t15160 [Musa balbisiana]